MTADTSSPSPTPEQVADSIVKELFPKQPWVNGVYPCIRPFVLAGMEHERRTADARLAAAVAAERERCASLVEAPAQGADAPTKRQELLFHFWVRYLGGPPRAEQISLPWNDLRWMVDEYFRVVAIAKASGSPASPRDARIAGLTAAQAKALAIIDLYFAPWGAAKAARWEDLVGDRLPNAEDALRAVRRVLGEAAHG